MLSKGNNPKEEPISDLQELNLKYHAMLHGWQVEKRQHQTGAFDKYYCHMNKGGIKFRSMVEISKYILGRLNNYKQKVEVVEKRSMKRKGECSILKSEFATKKHKSNNYDKSEVEKLLADARNT